MVVDKENKTITFELNEEDLYALEFVTNMGKISGEDLFREFIARYALQETRRYLIKNERREVCMNPGSPYMRGEMIDEEERMKRRIERWANSLDSIQHLIIKSYFKAMEKNQMVTKDDMFKVFECPETVGDPEFRFTANFRHLCSDAPGTYGKVFDFDKVTKVVTISEKYQNVIQMYKEKFLL